MCTHTRVIQEEHIARLLPIAFTAAFAIAATSATTVFAYASLMCQNPTDCREEEKKHYAGVVAIATTIANVCGILAIGLLRQWIKFQPKLGLSFWLLSRSIGVALLAVGVSLQNIYVAIAGKFFEGIATDNVLHYTLGTVYIRSKSPSQFSRLMGTSLALYMGAMSMSPTIVTLLPNFVWSFVVAIAFLGVSLVYLVVFVPNTTSTIALDEEEPELEPEPTAQQSSQLWISHSSLLFHYYDEAPLLFSGLSILFYNVAQAYLFPAIMVHAALQFGFTSTENGYVISIAALTSSIYLFFVLYAVPKASGFFVRRNTEAEEITSADRETESDLTCQGSSMSGSSSDAFFALLSMLIQLFVLPCFNLVRKPRELYGLIVLVALGLAAPSFIKSYAVRKTSAKDLALAGVAVMESLGGLFSPLVLGAVQSFMGQGSVFMVASSLVGAAMLCLIGSLMTRR